MGLGAVVAGCIEQPGADDGTSSGDDGSIEASVEEPDELPSTLVEDGIDVDSVREIVASVITSQAYEYVGIATLYETEDQDAIDESVSRSVAAEPLSERGIQVDGIDDTGITSGPREADRVDVFYFEDDSAYMNQATSEPEIRDGEFDDLSDAAFDRDLESVVDVLEDLLFEPPEWDGESGRYVVSGSGSTEDAVTIEEVKLHVEPNGLPIRLTGSWTEDGQRASADIRFIDGDVTVEEPDWIDDATPSIPVLAITADVHRDFSYDEDDEVMIIISHETGDELRVDDVELVLRVEDFPPVATFSSETNWQSTIGSSTGDDEELVVQLNGEDAVSDDTFAAGDYFSIDLGADADDAALEALDDGTEHQIDIVHQPSDSVVASTVFLMPPADD